MTKTRRLSTFGFALAATISSIGLAAQGDPATLIKEKLATDIKVSKAAADHSDVVTAGDVVVLHKDGLMMCSSASSYAFSNTYSNGVLAATYSNRAKDAAKSFFKGKLPFGGGGGVTDAANNGCTSRKFVAGEKFFVSDIRLHSNDGILVTTISDPYNDVRYYGEILFLFPKKGSPPPVDDFVKTVQEVITVQPSDDKDKGTEQTASKEAPAAATAPAAAAPAAAPAPMADIAPPPPPADAAPPTVEVGQTKDQVIAGFGQPTRILKPSAIKEIYVYKDMKVTFTKGKVSDIQ
jgi:hypothetical protein